MLTQKNTIHSLHNKTQISFSNLCQGRYHRHDFFSLTHIVCERLSVMQSWSSVKMLSKSHRIRYSWQRIPPPPRIGTSHGGLMDFSSELTRNTPSPELEPLMEDLGTQNNTIQLTVLSLPRISPQNWNFSWRTVQGTGEWRLAVSPD